MSFLYIIGVIILLVILFKRRSNNPSGDEIDFNSKSYAQGYWNGYRARQSEEADGKPATDTSTAAQQQYSSQLAENVVQQPVISPAEQKAKRDLQNINTALYSASFLLVAAAALFIGTSLPESVRFMGVWFITALFYLTGLYLHKNVPTLRPAAIAFAGTGMAILPFTGIAMYNLVLPDASLCWFITSVIGLLAFVYAAVSLKSQVVAYFAIAFAISMATSSVSTLGLGLIWYFVVLIGFGSLMTLISTIKPSFISSYFSGPIQQTNQWIVPLTLVASFFAITSLTLQDYWIITLISALYYGAVAASSSVGRDIAILFARILLSISALLIAYDLSDSWTIVGLTMSAVGILQVAVSSIFLPKHTAANDNNEIWLWIGLVMQLIAPLFVINYSSWEIIVTGQLSALIIMGFGIAYALSRTEVSGFSIAALAILPIVVAQNIFVPALESHWVAFIFIIFGIIAVAIRSMVAFNKLHPSIRLLSIVCFCLYTAEALLFTFGASYGWGFSIWFIAAGLLYLLVYLERQPWLALIANAIFLASTVWLLQLIDTPYEWRNITISWIAFITFYGIYLLTVDMSKRQYGVYFWISAMSVTGLLSFIGLFDHYSDSLGNTILFASAATMIVVAITMVIEGWKNRRYGYIDLGAILATIAMQRLIGESVDNVDMLVYTHWWAAIFAGLSYMYYKLDKKSDSTARVIVALSFITFFGGIAALSAGSEVVNYSSGYDINCPTINCLKEVVLKPPYQLIFLIEHVLLLITGLVVSRKMFAIWGAVGVVLAVLWMLKDITYIVLALAAFLLIGIAIYALIKQQKNDK